VCGGARPAPSFSFRNCEKSEKPETREPNLLFEIRTQNLPNMKQGASYSTENLSDRLHCSLLVCKCNGVDARGYILGLYSFVAWVELPPLPFRIFHPTFPSFDGIFCLEYGGGTFLQITGVALLCLTSQKRGFLHSHSGTTSRFTHETGFPRNM
jgi:hypothetical protein